MMISLQKKIAVIYITPWTIKYIVLKYILDWWAMYSSVHSSVCDVSS